MEELQKKIRKKERILMVVAGIICCLVFAAGIFYAARHLVNEAYNMAYGRGYYFDRTPTTQMIPNNPEGYIPFYNTGNNDFQNGRYQAARDNYLQALEMQPPHDEETTQEEEDLECKIRINLALSILYMIDFENLHLNDREAVDQAAEQLLVARGVLTAEDCAHFDDPEGHSADAEQLKKEIDELLERLNRKPPQEEQQNDNNNGGGGNQDQNEQQDGQSDREKEIERQLQDEMGDAKDQQMQSERDRERERAGEDGGMTYGSDEEEVQSW